MVQWTTGERLMKRPLFFLAFLALNLAIAPSFAIDQVDDLEDINEYLDQDDLNALKEWVSERKKQIEEKLPPGKLVLSGEVRTELQSTNEKLNEIKQRGSGSKNPSIATRTWDIELRLQLDYRTERTWAAARLRFDNAAGVEGTVKELKLDRAFYGGNIINASDYTVALQAGRWDLNLYFDSQVQFDALMDGVLIKYDHALDWLGDLYFRGGPFVVDKKVDHYAYVGEIGVLNIGRTGLYSKISFIDWDTKDRGNQIAKNQLKNREYQFFNWQVTAGYTWVPFKKTLNCFAAYLINTAAKRLPVTANHKANMAWYVGCRLGKLTKQWDWSFQLVYQWVQAQAVPGFDMSGIGHGNASGVGLYGKTSGDETVVFTSPSEARGNTNYRGFAAILQYMLTDNIVVYQRWKQSIRLSSDIGVPFSYKQYEIELIYSF